MKYLDIQGVATLYNSINIRLSYIESEIKDAQSAADKLLTDSL